MSTTKTTTNTKRLSVLAMFIAIAYICLFVFRIKVNFLTLELKDVFITMTGFIFGPLTAVCVALVEALLEMVTLSDTGFLGALMNFIGSASFALTASLIYKYKKNLVGAVIGLIAAVVVMTAVMLLLNIFITPIYMHVDRSVVYTMIPSLLLPFNLIKGTLNAAVLFVLYKPLSEALKSLKLIPKADSFKFDKKTLVVSLIALAIITAAIVCLIVFMNGNVEWIRK